MTRWVTPLAFLSALAGAPPDASAEPLRLRGDALARVEAPVGLLTLEAAGEATPWLSAEAQVWFGASDDSEADALVVSIRARDPEGRGQVRIGRFIATAGALRAIHVDGADGSVELPYDFRVELFGGVPVEPRFGADAYDLIGGGRISHALGDWGSAGVAYLHRRDRKRLADEEIGFDLSAAPTRWLDLSGRVAVDLIQTGVSEARVTAGVRRKSWNGAIYYAETSPSRILPATSLFSVLGDIPARTVGSDGRWRVAPRLDVRGSAAVRFFDSSANPQLSAGAVLRLDDRGLGRLSGDLRYHTAPDGDWWGARGTAYVPLPDRLFLGLEAELAVPENSDGRGQLWPWVLLSVGWRPTQSWEMAIAGEASATPQHKSRFDALFRLSRSWGGL